jgi:hypothetical protein
MSDVGIATDANQRAQARSTSVQMYARIAGVLFLVSLVAGGFGEAYVPSKLIVSGDAAATAKNIVASHSLFRLTSSTLATKRQVSHYYEYGLGGRLGKNDASEKRSPF